jgi:hypothetical protein
VALNHPAGRLSEVLLIPQIGAFCFTYPSLF